MFLLRHGSDLFHDVADKRLALAHLEYLRQESFGTLDVVVDDLVFVFVLRSLRSQFVNGGVDDRQRGEQLMCDVGQHHAHAQSVLRAQVLTVPANGGKGRRWYVPEGRF